MWQKLRDGLKITPNQWFDEEGELHIPKGHKMSSHLDLFFDLVFVVTLASLGRDFRGKAHDSHFSLAGTMDAVVDTLTLLVPILMNHIFLHGFTNRFGRGTISTAIFYLANFILLGLLTLNISSCSQSLGTQQPAECFDFCLFYGLSRGAIALAWLRVALTSTIARRYCAIIAFGNSVVTCLWLANVTQQANPLAFRILWWLPVAIDLGAMILPLLATLIFRPNQTQRKDPSAFIPIDYHLYDERMGLITLLAMGESVTGASGVHLHHEQKTRIYLFSIIVIATVFGLNMLYYRSGEALIKEGKHALRVSANRGVFWILLHVPLVFSMLLTGYVAEIIIDLLDDNAVLRSLYCCATGATFVISALLQSLHEGAGKVEKKMSKLARMCVRWACGAAIVLVGFIPQLWIESAMIVLIMVLIITTVGVVVDTYGSLPSGSAKKDQLQEMRDSLATF